MSPGQLPVLFVLVALGAGAFLAIGALLVQLGCRLTGAEGPSFGKALWVNTLGLAASALVNAVLAASLEVILGSLPSDANSPGIGEVARLIVKAAAAVFVLGLVYSYFLKKLSYYRALLLGLIMTIWIFAASSTATYIAIHAVPPDRRELGSRTPPSTSLQRTAL